MIRFALIAASTLGFFLTAALGNLMVPLLRAFQGRWDEPKARQAPGQEAPDAEPERPPQAQHRTAADAGQILQQTHAAKEQSSQQRCEQPD